MRTPVPPRILAAPPGLGRNRRGEAVGDRHGPERRLPFAPRPDRHAFEAHEMRWTDEQDGCVAALANERVGPGCHRTGVDQSWIRHDDLTRVAASCAVRRL